MDFYFFNSLWHTLQHTFFCLVDTFFQKKYRGCRVLLHPPLPYGTPNAGTPFYSMDCAGNQSGNFAYSWTSKILHCLALNATEQSTKKTRYCYEKCCPNLAASLMESDLGEVRRCVLIIYEWACFSFS